MAWLFTICCLSLLVILPGAFFYFCYSAKSMSNQDLAQAIRTASGRATSTEKDNQVYESLLHPSPVEHQSWQTADLRSLSRDGVNESRTLGIA